MFTGFKHLVLDRPLVVLDLETTGTDPLSDRVVELAAIRCEPGGRVARRRRQLFNPGVPIPPAASAVHGITDVDVSSAPAFKDVAPRLLEFLGDADLCGFNLAKFDLPMLIAEFDRAGLRLPLSGRAVVDPYEAFVKVSPRNLGAAVATYLGPERAVDFSKQAHGALADASAAAEVLDRMVAAHPELSSRPFDLQRVGGRADGTGRFRVVEQNGEWVVVFGFGKHRGRSLAEVAASDPGYCHWMLVRFPDDACELVRAALSTE